MIRKVIFILQLLILVALNESTAAEPEVPIKDETQGTDTLSNT